MRHIQELVTQLAFTPRTLVEVGAAHIGSYRLGHFVKAGFKVILVEANPRLFYCMTNGCNDGDFQKTWPAYPPPPYDYPPIVGERVQIINAAVTDNNGLTRIYERNASSFVGGIASPARQNDGYQEQEKDAYEVPSITIDKIDDGQIDVLLSDTEGCEWYCIKNLISRPKLIVLEMLGQNYHNPFKSEILNWMKTEGYTEIESDATDFAYALLP